jgi:amino acid permease
MEKNHQMGYSGSILNMVYFGFITGLAHLLLHNTAVTRERDRQYFTCINSETSYREESI